MKLESLDGTFVELVVDGYEFGSGRSDADGPNWDANWLIVRGKVWDGQQSWEFRDPCMTTWEARELAGWLKGLGNSSTTKTVESANPDDLRLWFTEPNLMFALESADQGAAEFSVHFDAEASPPAADEADLGHRVPLRIPLAVIATAVGAWEQALVDYPVR